MQGPHLNAFAFQRKKKESCGQITRLLSICLRIVHAMRFLFTINRQMAGGILNCLKNVKYVNGCAFDANFTL